MNDGSVIFLVGPWHLKWYLLSTEVYAAVLVLRRHLCRSHFRDFLSSRYHHQKYSHGIKNHPGSKAWRSKLWTLLEGIPTKKARKQTLHKELTHPSNRHGGQPDPQHIPRQCHLSIRYLTTPWSLYLPLLFWPLHSREFSILGVTQLLRVLSGMLYFTLHSITTKYTITTCTLSTLIFQLCIYLTLSGYEPCSRTTRYVYLQSL
jgi:hypothetical protein